YQGVGIAAAAIAHSRRIHRRAAILADQSLRAVGIEADGPADGTRIHHRRDLAVRLLVDEEAYRLAVDLGGIAPEVTRVHLRNGHCSFSVSKSDLSRRRQGSGALGVDELCSNEHDEDER